MVRTLGIAAVLGCVWLAPRAVAACDCERQELGPEIVEGWDVVFEGTARRSWIRDVLRGGTRSVEFGVRRVWRGELGGRVKVETARGDGMCGSRFTVGVSYVVFARRGADGRLSTDACGFNRRTRDADEVVRWLGEAEVPRSRGCSTIGTDAGAAVVLLLLARRRRSAVRVAWLTAAVGGDDRGGRGDQV